MPRQIKLGDTVAKLAKALGIKHCEKCEERRLILNEVQKIGLKETINKMRAVGRNAPKEKEQAIKEVITKLTDCCKN